MDSEGGIPHYGDRDRDGGMMHHCDRIVMEEYHTIVTGIVMEE